MYFYLYFYRSRDNKSVRTDRSFPLNARWKQKERDRGETNDVTRFYLEETGYSVRKSFLPE